MGLGVSRDRGAGLVRRLVSRVRKLSFLEARVSWLVHAKRIVYVVSMSHLLLSRDTSVEVGNFRARLTKFLEGSLCLFSSTLRIG